MSTKTTFKRVALVAVAALSFGMLSAVSASATTGWACTTAYSTSSCSQVEAGSVVVTFTAGTTDTTTVTTSNGKMSKLTASAGSVYVRGTVTAVSAGTMYTDVDFKPNAAADTLAVTITGGTGTTTVTAVTLNASGTPVNTYTKTITWIPAASTAVSAANSYLSVQDDGASCTAAGATHAADIVAASDYEYTASGVADGQRICVYARDSSGGLISGATVYLQVNKGSLDDYASVITTGVNVDSIIYTGNPAFLNEATVTATIVDANSNTASLTQTFVWLGATPATLSLTNVRYAAKAGGTTQASSSVALSSEGQALKALLLSAKDAQGNVINAHNLANLTFTVDSTGTDGVAAARTSDAVGATVAEYASNTDTTFLVYGGDYVTVGCQNSAAAEKLTITAWSKNSAGSWISSGTVDFFCSSTTAASIVVTPTSTDVVAGGTTTVNFKVTDKYGFPVPDGSSFSMIASNGAGIGTALTSTVNGALSTAATLIAPSNVSSVGVSVSAGTKVGSATIAVSGADTSANAADAAAEATDAANAATDAANAAAEAADAATAAAQDAADAVAALSAQVATLISGLKSQLTALTNLVIKIQKKVKA